MHSCWQHEHADLLLLSCPGPESPLYRSISIGYIASLYNNQVPDNDISQIQRREQSSPEYPLSLASEQPETLPFSEQTLSDLRPTACKQLISCFLLLTVTGPAGRRWAVRRAPVSQ